MNTMDEMGITYRSIEETGNAYKTLVGKPFEIDVYGS
jgi:hypothetical protein